ncbi:putative Acyl-CoA N-acyltransferase [Vibrio nigripulchritudo SOn1]|uniref:Acyl-CoA N-acyltransferase n=1 Tax=Vibrio nigripulchritudo SOn1 TaxID=1238450 RepID=A0AAV2VPG6_9VIBR|nr:GNAT family acetyltransferase [Vibrio nigripulchritudo]CCO46576.1 putative Acyl-CoA N-acyltransferase [Vibrio nigripulchritudo SOn1]
MNIRTYQPSDKQSIIAIWQTCGLVVPWNDPSKDIDIKVAHDKELFLVMEDSGKVVASVMGGYEGHRGWANYLAVDPEYQGTGAGRLLMEDLERRLKEKGCPKINLQVRNTNAKVIQFYEYLGYSIDESVSMGKRLDGVKK